MCDSMKEYFPEGITFTYPEGGLFTWVTLPEGMDAKELMPKVLAKNVAYVPGGPFYLMAAMPTTSASTTPTCRKNAS